MRRGDLLSRAWMTLLALTVACSTDSTQSGAQLSLVIGNTDVRSVQYDIVCEGGATFSSEFEVVDDRDPPIWETFVGLPAGENCVITLTAFDAAGNPICTGSTSVEILEGQTVKADITLGCPTTGAPATGSVNIDGRFEEILVDICPIVHILNAIPRVITEPSGESSLRVQASDPDGGAVETVLSASSGDIADPNATRTTFSCTQGGPVEVTVTAAPGNPNCQSTATTTLSCPDTGGLCDGVSCEDDGSECTAEACNPATGECESSNLANGTPCDGGLCRAGACVPDPLDSCDCVPDGRVCRLAGSEALGACLGGTCVDAPTTCDAADGSVCSCFGQITPQGLPACAAAANLCYCSCQQSSLGTPFCGGGFLVTPPDPPFPVGPDCNDRNECTVDSCAPTGNCENVPVEDGTPCEDDEGTCVSGLCELAGGE